MRPTAPFCYPKVAAVRVYLSDPTWSKKGHPRKVKELRTWGYVGNRYDARYADVRLNGDFTSDRQISQREMQRARRQQRASRRRDATTADVRVVVLYVAAVPAVLFVVTKLALGLRWNLLGLID